jgi:hypothetical protein
MLNDEEILLKTSKLLSNINEKRGFGEGEPPKDPKSQEWYKKRSIYLENGDKLLRELDEDEYQIVIDTLADLEPDDLAFNQLFAGKNRLIINFPTMDNQSELGQFAEELKNILELDVDWEKGMVSAQREWTENSIENDEAMLDFLVNTHLPNRTKKVNKKFQMKIGKYFMKVDKVLREFKEMRQIVAKHVYEDRATAAGYSVAFTVGQIKEAFTTEQLKRYYQLENGLELYMGTSSMGRINKYYGSYEDVQAGNVTKMPKLAKYWQENAGYIKKNIGELTNDKYSIILTRDPVDVMRMSDFDKITSCHSPPSRGSTQGSYYKCAVAEAHGHGAVAYVVETEDLYKWGGRDDLDMDEIEDEIQGGIEIFYDDKRHGDAGTIVPVSRTRLRQVRYYDTDTPKRYDEGTEIAVPEKRVYGANIPGFVDRIIAWARENQQKVIENIPKEDGKINLDRFMIFGGSYEDTANAAGRRALMSKLLGVDHVGGFDGSMKQDTATEDQLDANAISGLPGRWTQEVENTVNEWNERYAIVRVEADVEDDGDGGLYISARAVARIKIAKEDFVKTPNSYPTAMHAFDYVTSMYGDIFDVDNSFINYEGDNLIFGCDLNLEHPEIGESALFYDPDGLNEFCSVLDTNIDDKHDAFEAVITEFLKREGWLEGAAYVQLVDDIDNKDLSSYEWDIRTDGEHSTDSYESTASTSHDFDPEELGVNPQVLADILNSTGWRVMIRQALLKSAKEELETDYNVDINGTTAEISGSEHVGYLVQYEIEFIVNQDAPDKVIEVFRELVEGEMDDSDNLSAVFNNMMAQTLNSRLPASQQQNLDERLVKTWKGFLGRK